MSIIPTSVKEPIEVDEADDTGGGAERIENLPKAKNISQTRDFASMCVHLTR